MKITELLTTHTMDLALTSRGKEDTIDQLIDVLESAGKITDRGQFKEAILKREEQSTTGVGEGVAIPHAQTNVVKEPTIVFGRSKEGIEYDSLDGKPVYLSFMIAVPDGGSNTHLEALATLSRMLMKEDIRALLLNAETKEDIIHIIDQHENSESEDESNGNEASEHDEFLLAVTACPTGIAHTYMSADSLNEKAKEMGVPIKVETNGSGGAKNVLTQEDIEKATAIIVAADTKVEMNRFNGKHVIETSVADGIHKPQELIEQALRQDAPIYEGDGGGSASSQGSSGGRGVGSTIYKHLMNGVSNMLPFVIGGGILIALGFMFGINSHVQGDPTYNVIADALNTIGGGNAFALMIPVLAGFIASSIADRPGFAPGMVGGMMAATSGSGFLGGIVAGFLGGYIVVLLKKGLAKLPHSLEGIKTILLYPLLGISITGFIMFFVVNTPLSALNTGITHFLTGLGTGNAILLGIIIGLMMAFDLGGPVNKAAYLFGTGLLASGVYQPMAAVMAAGMVPPLATAIATTFFRHKFTKDERDAGKVNYIMGLSFITEGTIPFAAADPFRVIPSVMVGSAIAGGLSMLFNIGLRAPHGGIFVFPLVDGGWLLYLVAVLIGSIVSAIILASLKRKVA